METLVLNVKGMSCMGCVNSVKQVLRPLPGVSNVEVQLDAGKVEIRYEPGQTQPDQFRGAIRDAGYEVLN